jgi:hypothetical protein
MRSNLTFKSLLVALFAWFAYARCIRPWHLRWGATDDEVARPLPFDDCIPDPTVVSTRAITIHAASDRIWPWLVQMGDAPRAGYYSYTWIERLMGMQIENSNRIMAEYQTLAVGDCIDKNGTMIVLGIEPGRSLVLGPPETVDWLLCTWAFNILPLSDDSSRLVTRVRAKWSYAEVIKKTPPLSWPMWPLLDPGVFIMERKMLLGIKERVEADARRHSCSSA